MSDPIDVIAYLCERRKFDAEVASDRSVVIESECGPSVCGEVTSYLINRLDVAVPALVEPNVGDALVAHVEHHGVVLGDKTWCGKSGCEIVRSIRALNDVVDSCHRVDDCRLVEVGAGVVRTMTA